MKKVYFLSLSLLLPCAAMAMNENGNSKYEKHLMNISLDEYRLTLDEVQHGLIVVSTKTNSKGSSYTNFILMPKTKPIKVTDLEGNLTDGYRVTSYELDVFGNKDYKLKQTHPTDKVVGLQFKEKSLYNLLINDPDVLAAIKKSQETGKSITVNSPFKE